jgi:hypothetical protein
VVLSCPFHLSVDFLDLLSRHDDGMFLGELNVTLVGTCGDRLDVVAVDFHSFKESTYLRFSFFGLEWRCGETIESDEPQHEHEHRQLPGDADAVVQGCEGGVVP